MNKFIRLYDSKFTPITGDIFTLVRHYYSEDNDIKDITGNNITKKTDGKAAVDYFIEHGYTYGDPNSSVSPTGKGGTRYPLKYPRQMYLVNDTSGSVNSDFVNELESGDIIHVINNTDEKTWYKFEVFSTGCIDCDANTVKLVSLDQIDENERWKLDSTELLRTQTIDGTTSTLNQHATKAVIEQKTDTYIDVDPNTIISYKENSSIKYEMIVTFKEGIFPKGGYTVLKDITHTGALNDIIIDATSYTGDQVDIKIEIDSTTNPETFKWRFGEYISSTAPSSAYAEEQRGLSLQFIPLDLGDGEIRIKWLATTGHTTDTWTFTVYPNNKRIYRNQIRELDKIYK